MLFVTWNIKKTGGEHARHRLPLLQRLDWDVIALQEVSPQAWDVLASSNVADASCYTFQAFALPQLGKQPHGVAILARHGYTLSEPAVIPQIPKPERGLTVRLSGLARPVTVVSWHAPNAAGEGVTIKMQGYHGIINWLKTVTDPIVFGFDGNHWNPSVALDPAYVPPSKDRWLLENQFYGRNGLHQLRDAYLDHLRNNSHEYENILKLRPQGPLAVSYIRGPKHKCIEDRFDYVFVSEEIVVRNCTYNYEDATEAGSDHGIVMAHLDVHV